MRPATGVAFIAMLAMAPVHARVHAQPSAPPANPAAAADPQRQGDARTEHALRRVLGVLMQHYGDLTGKVPESLNDADIAMRQAVQALDAGNDAAAAAATQKAIEALQQGGRSMSAQLARQFGRNAGEDGDEDSDEDGQTAGETGNQEGRGEEHGRRDPLGRPPLGQPSGEDGNGQSLSESGVHVPDRMEQARAHAIQEELRRREAEKTRPQPELDYIERLLRQF